MLKTLARKHRSSVTKMAARHKAKIATPHGPRTRFEASVERAGRKPLVAWFGGIPLKRQKNAVLTDRRHTGPVYPNRQLVTRLLKGRCELCERTDNISCAPRPHARRSRPDRAAAAPMGPGHGQDRRKALVVCGDCHDLIHGHPASPLTQ